MLTISFGVRVPIAPKSKAISRVPCPRLRGHAKEHESSAIPHLQLKDGPYIQVRMGQPWEASPVLNISFSVRVPIALWTGAREAGVPLLACPAVRVTTELATYSAMHVNSGPVLPDGNGLVLPVVR